MNGMKKITIVALVAAALSLSHSALATHKAWLMKNGGAECTFAYPEATDRMDSSGAIYNSGTSERDVICPIALSGRWGSNGTTAFNAKRWGDALSAIVYFDRRGAGTRTVSCYAAMRASDSFVYYSASVSNTGGSGVGRLDVAGSTSGGGQWAGGTGNGTTLEAQEDTVVKGLEFVCSVPERTAILGYKAKLCQLTGDCTHGSGDPEDDTTISTSGWNYVQTSGIECSAAGTEGAIASVYRHGYGATNLGSSPVDIFCPVAPPSDDSREHNRSVTDTTVYYSDLYNTSSSNLNSCVGGATCPSCRLMWYDRDGIMQDTGALSKIAGVRKLHQAGTELIGKELQFGVMCRTPPGLTIEGITSLVTVSDISGGI
ncbi:hypothetical protein BE18_15645 [Sorangium cellulosum]|uniref:Secreted protein n=1 Tax=Sorangium cellulosum TaxID=56 RepID=A0A150RQ65_SORCE|nr:hypothetical protein BE18_15645 [Sorangium cellulosum]